MSSAIDNVSIHSVEELNSKIPGYKITDFIAKGGMGAVYLGLQENLDRQVAIKVLPPELTQDEGFRTAFQTEAKAMAKVSHTNLVGIYDFGKIDNFLYIVMEFVKGRTLFDATNGAAVEESEAAELIIAMCRGLNKAHEAGIIHRDIKPANVLIDHNGTPKIVDFGLARPTEQTEEGTIFGTPGYTAPEVVKNPKAVDQKSDIFSIGAMLFELLTGQLPSSPGQLPSHISNSDKKFDRIISKATHPMSAMRYTSASEMADDLQKLVDSKSSNAAQTTAGGVKLVAGANATTPRAGQVNLSGRSQAIGAPPRYIAKKSGSPIALIATIIILLACAGLGVMVIAGQNQEEQPISSVNDSSKTKQSVSTDEPKLKTKNTFKKVDLNASVDMPDIPNKKIEPLRNDFGNPSSTTTTIIIDETPRNDNVVKTKFGSRKIGGNNDTLLFSENDLESSEVSENGNKRKKRRFKKNASN